VVDGTPIVVIGGKRLSACNRSVGEADGSPFAHWRIATSILFSAICEVVGGVEGGSQ